MYVNFLMNTLTFVNLITSEMKKRLRAYHETEEDFTISNYIGWTESINIIFVIYKLQKHQNTAARLVSLTTKRQQITSVL